MRKDKNNAAPIPENESTAISWIPAKLAWVFAGLWWAIVVWHYFHGNAVATQWRLWQKWDMLIPTFWLIRFDAVWSHLIPLAFLAWFIFLGHEAGRAIMLRGQFESNDKLGMALVRVALGWGTMALGMLLLGSCGLWYRPVIYAILTVGTVAAGFGLRRKPSSEFLSQERNAIKKSRNLKSSPWGHWEKVCVYIFFLMVVINLYWTFSPEIFFDALTYHLAIPDIYWKHHGLVATPENLYSGLPMLVEMLFGLSLPVGGDVLARLMSWAMGLGTALFIFSLARLSFSRTTSIVASLTFYSIPLVGMLSRWSAVDLGWAFFEIAALYALSLRLTETRSPRWTLLGAVFVGFAMGCRYQAWPLLGVVTGALIWTLPGTPQERRREIVRFFLLALLIAVPWCLKNFYLYRNPIYPFLQEHFASWPQPDWQGLLRDGHGRDPIALTRLSGLAAVFTYPWTTPSGLLGPMMLIGLPALILFHYAERPLSFLRLVFIGASIIWLFTTTMDRFLLPQAPILCIFLAALLEKPPLPFLKPLFRAGLLVLFCSTCVSLAENDKESDAENVILGVQPAAEFLKSSRPEYPSPSYAAIEFINRELPHDSRVLFLGESRGYYCERNYVAITKFDGYPLFDWIRRSRDVGQLRDFFSREGITHVLLNRYLFNLWQEDPGKYRTLDEKGRKLLTDFTAQFLQPVFGDDNHPTIVLKFVPEGLRALQAAVPR